MRKCIFSLRNTLKFLALTSPLLVNSLEAARPQDASVSEEKQGIIIIEAESVALEGNWILHGKDSQHSFVNGFTGNGCIQFVGNTEVTGPPDSPLTYRFKVNRAGDYKLMARALEAPLESNQGDKANDCYVRLVGVPNYQGEFTKFVLLGDSYKWSWNVKLESSHHYFESPLYPLNQGVYQIQVAGRSKNFFLDRLALYRIDDGDSAQDLTLKQQLFVDRQPPEGAYQFMAIEHFSPVMEEGFGTVYVDKGRMALAVNAAKEELRKVFSAADMAFTGKSGIYDITIETLTEIDGESTYRLFLNDQRIGNYTNPGTAIDYSPSYYRWQNVTVRKGDTLRVECKPATNGRIPEGNGTAWSRGRWVSLRLAPSQ